MCFHGNKVMNCMSWSLCSTLTMYTFLFLSVEYQGKLRPIYEPKEFLSAILRVRSCDYVYNPSSERLKKAGPFREEGEEERACCEESLVGIINVKSLFTLVSWQAQHQWALFRVARLYVCVCSTVRRKTLGIFILRMCKWNQVLIIIIKIV